jgi:opacity protein-like surface antigen
MPAITRCLLAIVLVAALAPARAEVEIAPFAGLRMGGEFRVNDRNTYESDTLKFKDSEAFGVVLNFDLEEAGKQAELYFGRQETTASTSDRLLTEDSYSVDVTIYQLQFGGLYFPGRKNTGGFVSGVLGVTRLEPTPSGLDDHHRASIALGGGYKLALTDNLLARFDLRGIYTVLDSGGSVFCDGGCAIRFDSNGYGQVEASAGLALRF